jgi:hypothetical protein
MVFQKWDPTGQRDVVTKHVPGYVQPASFDLYAQADTISIDGTLVGSSASNLASQMETLRAMFRNKMNVWIDATDVYQGVVNFARITKLSGPTLDYKMGPLVATFSLEAAALLPWGTTQINPWSQLNAANDFAYAFRDLSGVGREYVLNPLDMNCNFTINSSTNQFSWEFILDNQNHFTTSYSLLNNFSSTSNLAGVAGSGWTFAVDTLVYRGDSGNQSVRVSGTSNSSGNFSFKWAPSSAVSLSGMDFLCVWVRGGFGGASSGAITVIISDGTSAIYWTFSNIPSLIWYRLIMPLHFPTSGGSVNYASVTSFTIQTTGTASASTQMWAGELAADIGLNTWLEFMVPDNIAQNPPGGSGAAINVQSWNGSSYQAFLEYGAFESTLLQNSPFYTLDGTDSSNLYNYSGGPGYYGAYPPGTIGSTKSPNASGPTLNGGSPITYNTTWGTYWRLGIALRMPPATSDSLAGGYPSDDLSGVQAINKVRLKVAIYYANEDTTYTGY